METKVRPSISRITYVVVILALLLSACGGPAPAPTAAPPGAATQAPAPPTKGAPVKVVYLSAGTADVEQDWNKKWVKKFNDTHTDIQIDYQLIAWADLLPKVAAMIAAGTPPDIAWYAPSQIVEWYYGGLLEPLDTYMPNDIKELLPPMKDPVSSDIIYDGKYYGMPFCLAGLGIVVRTDKFKEAGYDVKDLGKWDWAKYKEILAKVTKPPSQYGYVIPMGDPRIGSGAVGPFFQGNGLRDFTDFAPEKKAAYIETLKYIESIFPYTPPPQLQWGHPDLLTGYMNSIIMSVPQGSYFFGDIRRQAPVVMSEQGSVVLPYPRGPQMKTNVAPWYTVGWVMFKASKNKAAAAEVLKFLAAKEAVNEWPMNMAPKVGLTTDDRVKASEFKEDVRWWLGAWQWMVDNTTPIQRMGYAPATELQKMFNDELILLYNKKVTAEQFYDDMKKSMEPILIKPKK